jgi:hypothetical protein
MNKPEMTAAEQAHHDRLMKKHRYSDELAQIVVLQERMK